MGQGRRHRGAEVAARAPTFCVAVPGFLQGYRKGRARAQAVHWHKRWAEQVQRRVLQPAVGREQGVYVRRSGVFYIAIQ